MIKIPSEQKEWTQANQSDLFGNIYITKNVNFDDQGYLTLSYSPRAAIDELINTDFNNPSCITENETYGGYFCATWEDAFTVDRNILSVRPTLCVTAGVPATDTETDIAWFGGLMVVSQDTDVDYFTPGGGGVWTDTNITLTGGGQKQHAVVHFLSLSALAIANSNTVGLYASPFTATPTLITTLTINSNFQITGMCYFNQNLYIATHNRYGGHAAMYVWNGLGTAANQVFEVDSNLIFALCSHMNTIICLTGNGSLLRFNGAGFDPLPNGNFPCYYKDISLSDTVNLDMYKNVMKSNGNLLYILFTSSGNSNNRLLDMPDGIWCYDERVGLYHRYSLSNSVVQYDTVSTVDVSVANNLISTLNPVPVTGTECIYQADVWGALTPLVNETIYFIIAVDATHYRLATTYANAMAGIPIVLTGTGNDFQKIMSYPNVDFGQYFTERTTALTVIERPTESRQYGVDVIWGAEIFRRNTTSDYGTLGTVCDKIGARGYFITSKGTSNNVVDTQNLVTIKFSKFKSELDKIIIKYRTEDDRLTYANISGHFWEIFWTSATTFTTTSTFWADAVVGNEVEVLQGAAGGLLAHITAISEAGGTYTVTIDEPYANYTATDMSSAVFRNWKKWKTIEYGDSASEMCYLSEQLGSKGKFIQLKVELRGIQTRIEELLVDNVSRLPAKS